MNAIHVTFENIEQICCRVRLRLARIEQKVTRNVRNGSKEYDRKNEGVTPRFCSLVRLRAAGNRERVRFFREAWAASEAEPRNWLGFIARQTSLRRTRSSACPRADGVRRDIGI